MVGHRLEEGKIRREAHALRLDRAQPDVADQTAHDPRHVERGFAQRDDTIGQHAAALAINQRNRQVAFIVFARDNFVNTSIGKEIGPTLELAVIERIAVGAIKIRQTRAQFQ